MKGFPLLLFLVILPASGVLWAEPPASSRPVEWAQPRQVTGLPNLHKVSDGLYRCAQPTAEGFANVGTLGVKTVVNLRSFHSDKELLGNAAVGYESIPMKAWHPEEEDIVRFLKIVSDPKRGPVLVHCQHGADRTGTMCAIYRIAVQGWSKKEALREMQEGGFGFHGVWQDLVRFIDKLDIDKIRKKAGIQPPAPGGGGRSMREPRQQAKQVIGTASKSGNNRESEWKPREVQSTIGEPLSGAVIYRGRLDPYRLLLPV